MKLKFGRLRRKSSLSLEERNRLLEKDVVAREARAELLEEEAKLRWRLEAAELRCRVAKRNPRSAYVLKWGLAVFVVVLILFAMFAGC